MAHVDSTVWPNLRMNTGQMNGNVPTELETFREAYCRRFSCPVDHFERKVFWRALYPHSIPVAWLILLLKPKYFANDFAAIRQFGILRTREEAHSELDGLAYTNRHQPSSLRNVFRVRVSGRRLLRLFGEALQREGNKKDTSATH